MADSQSGSAASTTYQMRWLDMLHSRMPSFKRRLKVPVQFASKIDDYDLSDLALEETLAKSSKTTELLYLVRGQLISVSTAAGKVKDQVIVRQEEITLDKTDYFHTSVSGCTVVGKSISVPVWYCRDVFDLTEENLQAAIACQIRPAIYQYVPKPRLTPASAARHKLHTVDSCFELRRGDFVRTVDGIERQIATNDCQLMVLFDVNVCGFTYYKVKDVKTRPNRAISPDALAWWGRQLNIVEPIPPSKVGSDLLEENWQRSGKSAALQFPHAPLGLQKTSHIPQTSAFPPLKSHGKPGQHARTPSTPKSAAAPGGGRVVICEPTDPPPSEGNDPQQQETPDGGDTADTGGASGGAGGGGGKEQPSDDQNGDEEGDEEKDDEKKGDDDKGDDDKDDEEKDDEEKDDEENDDEENDDEENDDEENDDEENDDEEDEDEDEDEEEEDEEMGEKGPLRSPTFSSPLKRRRLPTSDSIASPPLLNFPTDSLMSFRPDSQAVSPPPAKLPASEVPPPPAKLPLPEVPPPPAKLPSPEVPPPEVPPPTASRGGHACGCDHRALQRVQQQIATMGTNMQRHFDETFGGLLQAANAKKRNVAVQTTAANHHMEVQTEPEMGGINKSVQVSAQTRAKAVQATVETAVPCKAKTTKRKLETVKEEPALEVTNETKQKTKKKSEATGAGSAQGASGGIKIGEAESKKIAAKPPLKYCVLSQSALGVRRWGGLLPTEYVFDDGYVIVRERFAQAATKAAGQVPSADDRPSAWLNHCRKFCASMIRTVCEHETPAPAVFFPKPDSQKPVSMEQLIQRQPQPIGVILREYATRFAGDSDSALEGARLYVDSQKLVYEAALKKLEASVKSKKLLQHWYD